MKLPMAPSHFVQPYSGRKCLPVRIPSELHLAIELNITMLCFGKLGWWAWAWPSCHCLRMGHPMLKRMMMAGLSKSGSVWPSGIAIRPGGSQVFAVWLHVQNPWAWSGHRAFPKRARFLGAYWQMSDWRSPLEDSDLPERAMERESNY